ncbi:MAG: hypothetical protein Q9170_001142 [Blastenia crenularia]
MSEPRYSRLIPVPASAPPDKAEPKSMSKDKSPSRFERVMALGQPTRKPIFDYLDLLAVVASLICLVVAICVVYPDRYLSWRLGFEGQIVVIGFLLGIMNLCLKSVTPTLFLMIETRWGGSRLQNYESILRNSLFLSNAGMLWRITLLFLVVFPLGLSAAYKRFTGGRSSIGVESTYDGHYGLAPPPIQSYGVLNNSIFFMINSSTPFWDASSHDDRPLDLGSLPLAYGYNILLLDNSSTALLDMPAPDYISTIQRHMRINGEQAWRISASVHATVARYDAAWQSDPNDDSFWKPLFQAAQGHGQLSSIELFQAAPGGHGLNYELGLISGIESGNPFCLLSYFSGRLYKIDTDDYNTDHARSFRASSPMRFNTSRELCEGTWEITRSDIQLLHGSCSGVATVPVTSANANDIHPYYVDILPILAQSIVAYSPAGSRSASQWRMPALVTNVAAMYWSRWVYMNPYYKPEFTSNPELYYAAADETIVSTKSTLDADWLLYVVLAVIPFMTVVMFVMIIAFRSTPIGKGFGIVAILAGVDRDSLDVLEGAGLSGELKKPVGMGIKALDRDPARVRYSIGAETQGKGRLRKGVKYS